MEALPDRLNLNLKSIFEGSLVLVTLSCIRSTSPGNLDQYLPLSLGTNQSIDVFVFVSVL